MVISWKFSDLDTYMKYRNILVCVEKWWKIDLFNGWKFDSSRATLTAFQTVTTVNLVGLYYITEMISLLHKARN